MFELIGKRLVVCLAVVGMAALSYSLLVLGQSVNFAKNVPMTYTISAWSARSYKADDSARDEYTKRGAVRSDGSSVMETTTVSEEGHTSTLRGIMDLEAGTYTMLDAALESKTTTILTPERITNTRERRPGCRGEVESSILGYDVIRQADAAGATGLPISDGGRLRQEALVAPDLGCLVMDQKLILTGLDGSERVVRHERVVDVQLGDPSVALFAIPAGYKEMSPAERMVAIGRATAAQISNDIVVQKAERDYQERAAP